jgi:hypothetical protein
MIKMRVIEIGRVTKLDRDGNVSFILHPNKSIIDDRVLIYTKDNDDDLYIGVIVDYDDIISNDRHATGVKKITKHGNSHQIIVDKTMMGAGDFNEGDLAYVYMKKVRDVEDAEDE